MTAEIKLSPDSHSLLVFGVLSFATVPGLRDLGNKLIKDFQGDFIVDLKEVTRSDSAALALLTAWSREAKHLGKSVQFINIPKQLMDIARLSNLDKVLSLTSSSKN